MCSITFSDGRRINYKTFSDFADAREVLRNSSANYVSYYDADGYTHVCEFSIVKHGLYCLGEITILDENTPVWDCAGIRLSNEIYELAGKVVKYERFDEFLGWSI